MKCKAIGCCTHAYSSTGYCHRHLYLVKANRIVSKAGSIICNKKGCKNITETGKRYCTIHNLFNK